jgi:Prp8 binding protein
MAHNGDVKETKKRKGEENEDKDSDDEDGVSDIRDAKSASSSSSSSSSSSAADARGAKKQKTSEGALVVQERKPGQLILAEGPTRTSGLLAPTMCLTGHQSAIHSVKFDPEGTHIVSGSNDKTIMIWETYGECKNICQLRGHGGDVLEVCWNRDGSQVYSASTDKTAAVWDVEEGERVKKIRDHTSYVNAVCASRRGDPYVLTGSDDCTAMLWDIRTRPPQHIFETEYPITAVALSDDSTQVFAAGVEEVIHCWDVRKDKILYSLEGHQDTITGIRVSPDGSYILSSASDHTLRVWDIRPFVSAPTRMCNIYQGARHDFQALLLKCGWSADGSKVSCGSADSFVYVWDVQTGNILYKLPGHAGAVSEVNFHPKEPVIVSGAQDKKIFLGEIV